MSEVSRRFRALAVVIIAAFTAALGSSLIVDPGVANAATQTINIVNPGQASAHPGWQVDAEIDDARHTVTVVQRGLYDPSRLTVRWVNLRTGRTGSTGLPGLRQNPLPAYPDRYAVLPTGAGNVIISVSGRVPGGTGLFPTGSESLGFMPPTSVLLNIT